jgi:hypothetical protein
MKFPTESIRAGKVQWSKVCKKRFIHQFIIDVETGGWLRETMYYGRVFRTIQRSEIELVLHDLAHDHSAFLRSRAHTACPWLINL